MLAHNQMSDDALLDQMSDDELWDWWQAKRLWEKKAPAAAAAAEEAPKKAMQKGMEKAAAPAEEPPKKAMQKGMKKAALKPRGSILLDLVDVEAPEQAILARFRSWRKRHRAQLEVKLFHRPPDV